MGRPIKDEIGHQYGPFIVYEETSTRQPLNGTARWKCRCRHCGQELIFNGNGLRFGNIRKACDNCGANK